MSAASSSIPTTLPFPSNFQAYRRLYRLQLFLKGEYQDDPAQMAVLARSLRLSADPFPSTDEIADLLQQAAVAHPQENWPELAFLLEKIEQEVLVFGLSIPSLRLQLLVKVSSVEVWQLENALCVGIWKYPQTNSPVCLYRSLQQDHLWYRDVKAYIDRGEEIPNNIGIKLGYKGRIDMLQRVKFYLGEMNSPSDAALAAKMAVAPDLYEHNYLAGLAHGGHLDGPLKVAIDADAGREDDVHIYINSATAGGQLHVLKYIAHQKREFLEEASMGVIAQIPIQATAYGHHHICRWAIEEFRLEPDTYQTWDVPIYATTLLVGAVEALSVIPVEDVISQAEDCLYLLAEEDGTYLNVETFNYLLELLPRESNQISLWAGFIVFMDSLAGKGTYPVKLFLEKMKREGWPQQWHRSDVELWLKEDVPFPIAWGEWYQREVTDLVLEFFP